MAALSTLEHAEHQDQDEQHAEHLLDDVPEPRLRVERNAVDLFGLGRGERRVDHADAVAAAGVVAHRILYQAGEARQFVGAPGLVADLAGLRVDLHLVVQHHRHRQSAQAPLLLLGVADRAVQFIVAGSLVALVGRVRRQLRLAGLRIDDGLAVGVLQRLARRDVVGRRAGGGLLRRAGRARRLVRQRPRHALRAGRILPFLVVALLAAQGRLVRVVHLRGRLDRAEVDVGGHLGLVATVAQHRLQDIVHALGEQAFHAPGEVELLAGHGQLGELLLVGEQVALLVDHGDLRLVQLRHTGGDQVDDRHHLARLQAAPRIQLDQHRGAGLAVVADEHRTLRDRQVHAGGLDVVQARHGARQLAFQAAAIVGGFHELAGAQRLFLVEDLETDVVVGRRHAGGGHLHACPAEVVGLDQQRAGVGFDLVGNVRRGQRFHHTVRVDPVEAAIERLVVRLLGPEHDGEADRHAGGETDQQADLAQHGHLGKVVEERQSREGFLQHPGTAALGGNLAVDQCIGHELVILAPLRPASA